MPIRTISLNILNRTNCLFIVFGLCVFAGIIFPIFTEINSKMKRNLYLLAVITFMSVITSFAQTPSWIWAKREGGASSEYGNSITSDTSGNVIVTGYFTGANIAFGSTTLTRFGSSGDDIFTVKYNNAGTVQWAKSIGGTSDDISTSVTTDIAGNVYVTGSFLAPTLTVGSTLLANTGGSTYTNDVLIVKYDPSGAVLWAKNAGGNTIDVGNCVAVDASGYVYVAGRFQSPTMNFGSIQLTNAGGQFNPSDIFVGKYTSARNIIWAKRAGGRGDDNAWSVACDATGGVFITGGFYSDTLVFGNDTIYNGSTPGFNFNDVFIAKYDSSGNPVWAKHGLGHKDDYGRSITTDLNGNAYVTGTFASDTLMFGTDSLFNHGVFDIFIAKYSSIGNLQWVKNPGGNDQDYGMGIRTDVTGNVFITGRTQSGVLVFDTVSIPNTGASDVYIAKYNSTGNALWGKLNAGAADAGSEGLALDPSGNAWITGEFAGNNIIFGSTTLTCLGLEDMLIAKLGSGTTVGIDNNLIGNNNSFQIYPNPANSKITIMMNETVANGNLEIYSVLGEKIYSETFSQAPMKEITLTDFSPGIYFVKVMADEKEFTKKFIIE